MRRSSTTLTTTTGLREREWQPSEGASCAIAGQFTPRVHDCAFAETAVVSAPAMGRASQGGSW
eukprot:3356917-Prymnesium_polylepis.2